MNCALQQLGYAFVFSIYKAELSCKINALAFYFLSGWSTGWVLYFHKYIWFFCFVLFFVNAGLHIFIRIHAIAHQDVFRLKNHQYHRLRPVMGHVGLVPLETSSFPAFREHSAFTGSHKH